MIHSARIETRDNGLFEFVPGGEPAVVSPVLDRYGELCDLVAWRIDEPGTWWLRYGDETPVLGARNLAIAAWYGDPITLHPTPLTWLLAGPKGACIVKWSWPLDDLFAGVGIVECASAPLKRKLSASLRRWEPRIVVRQESRHAA